MEKLVKTLGAVVLICCSIQILTAIEVYFWGSDYSAVIGTWALILAAIALVETHRD